MRILSLDTSFSFFNLSVIKEGKVSLIHYLDSSRKTLENLPAVLKDLSIDPKEFDAFAVSVGVGYLTSLRIGVTFMKTTAYLTGKPIVSYENLSLLARFTPVQAPKIPYLKVSTNLFYKVVNDDESPVRIHKGEGLEGVGISLQLFSDVEITKEKILHHFFPFSAYGGLVAWEKLREDPQGEDPFLIEPVYVKPAV